ncbi:hypothetical protein L4D00_21805 [Photobacterium swingsii]|uniref:hypothetical protein n=1 Tax=Photobacterium swingsii TaxID=680026 RepID=UPI00354D3939
MTQSKKPETSSELPSQKQTKPELAHSSRKRGKQEEFGMSETRFWIRRLSKTGLRALHITGIAMASAGILYQVESYQWQMWWMLAMATGVLMMISEILSSRLWLIQLKGVLTFVKLGLLASFIIIPESKPALFATILILSVFIAHGPAGLRHYSIWHRRRIDEKKHVKG